VEHEHGIFAERAKNSGLFVDTQALLHDPGKGIDFPLQNRIICEGVH